VVSLSGGDRHYAGAVVTLAAALCTLVAAALLMRSAASGDVSAKYVAPASRRSMARRNSSGPGRLQTPEMSERMLWDALDEGCDPTDGPADAPPGSDAEGR
jgi:uncharacterized membrane protein (TIGR02234 family)